MLASTMENLGMLVDLPTGCGEQNMVRFTPAVHIIRYLSHTQQLSAQMERSLTEFITKGL